MVNCPFKVVGNSAVNSDTTPSFTIYSFPESFTKTIPFYTILVVSKVSYINPIFFNA
jgi:hypothetical protein